MLNANELKALVTNLKPVKSREAQFKVDCKEKSDRISTGWLSIDKVLNGGLTNELYIMGAETSTGKSAFMMSLAQNIAKQKVNVLYFSLEMGTKEFIARAISNLSYEAHTEDKNKRAFTASDVLYWTYDEGEKVFTKMAYSSYSEYADKYFATYGDNLYIIEAGLDGFCAKDIANIAALFKKAHTAEQVVVFVDYLQILKADQDDRSQTDRKTKTDVAVTTLKALASQIGMPVLTVSSISRSNYNGKITTASFKESGDTEYTGGILIGWNWHGVTDTTDKDMVDAEKKACAERGYRKMVFEVLKFRNSQRDHDVQLYYYPAYNYFVDKPEFQPDDDNDNPFKNSDKKVICNTSSEAVTDKSKRKCF